MTLSKVPHELTTAATDAAMGVFCLVCLVLLVRLHVNAPWKQSVWSAVLAALAGASIVGAIAHGFEWSPAVLNVLWPPLYLMLSLSVTLFVVGAIYDWQGQIAAQQVLPWAIGAAIGMFLLIQFLGGAFVIFVVYETLAMISALIIYGMLAVRGGLPGAALVAIGVALTIVAGIVQTTQMRLHVIVPFDHNGIFHLIQLAATAVLVRGLQLGLQPS